MLAIDTNPQKRARRSYVLPSARHEGSMWLYWLVQFRWVALIAQAIVLAFTVRVLDSPVWTVPAMVMVMWVLLVANHWAFRTLEAAKDVDDVTLFNHLGLDVIALTALLLLSGGGENPFVILYLVHMALAALVLSTQGAAFIGLSVLAAYSLMQFVYLPLHPERHFWLSADALMALGNFTAFSVALASIGFFMVGASNSWRRRERQLREARAHLGTPNTEELPWPEAPEDGSF